MPHRRTTKKGSFGGHFDELVSQFHNEAPETKDGKVPSKDKRHINDKLFESAWRRPPR